jgi:iron-sulfur cluster repair protein YtfE (RIC family)
MPFAVMRNAHEAMRASIRLQEMQLDSGDLEGFREEWTRYRKALAVHMAMEDEALFELLDEISEGAIAQAGLRDEHTEDERLADAVDAGLENGDPEALSSAWTRWKSDHLQHLSHEEQIMMPLVPKTAEMPGGMARVVHDRLLAPSEHLPNFDWYLGWVVGMLSQHGSTEHPPNVATRVFAWALQTDSTPEEWERLRPVVHSNCTPEIWRELVSEFGLDGEGKIIP